MFSCAQREKRVKKRGEEKRREKNLSSSSFSSLFSGKTKTRETSSVFFARRKKKKREESLIKTKERRKKRKPYVIKYIPRARVEMSKRLQVQRRKRPRGGYTKRVRRLFWWSVFISHVCATFTAQTEHVFFLFLCTKEEKKICPLALSHSFSCLKTTQQKREEKRRNENEKKLIKKNIIKNVAARALRKTSVLSFRVHHARDIFVMNRWRSSVFFIWTRMYLYITVYPPLLFCLCFFSSSSSSCFFGTLAKEVFAFSIKKKRKKEKSFFLRFSSLSFLVLSGAFERDKKKESSFFSSTIWREQTNERECVAEIEKYDRRKSPKRRRSIEEGTFPFLLCRFVFLFLIRMLFRFERRERKGNHQKSPKKERKNSLVGPKNSGSSSSSSFFCSKNASRQRTKGVTK